MKREATISADGRYRYSLTRVWNPMLQTVMFVMLNPSTADGMVDDATIRRCIAFAKSWGYGGIVVVNLYAYRATIPHELLNVTDPVGRDNDAYIYNLARTPGKVVCAWGESAAERTYNRAARVIPLLKEVRRAGPFGTELYCLKKTLGGHPAHPLRLRADMSLEVYR